MPDTISDSSGNPPGITLTPPESILQELSRHQAYNKLILNSIGFYREESNPTLPEPANSAAHTLIYNASGTGFTQQPGKPQTRQNIEKESFILIPRGEQILFGSLNGWSIYRICFSGESSDNLLTELAVNTGIPCYIRNSHQIVITLFEHLISCLQPSPTLENTAYAGMLLWHALACFIFRNPILHAECQVDTVEDSIRYMEKNLNRELSLEELSAVAGYSPSHYCTIFKEKTGEAPITYFISLKMHLAAEYLIQSSKSVKEISWLLGYSSQYYFSRLFKSHLGVSPSDYRSQHTPD